jgi:Zn finger protein HypA/HybF involved in hydrogenase expression
MMKIIMMKIIMMKKMKKMIYRYTNNTFMVLKIKEHIDISKNMLSCKNCKKLFIIKYYQQNLCIDCDKIYKDIINKIML